MAPNQRRPARGPATKGGARTATTLTVAGVIALALLAISGIAVLIRGANDTGAPVAAKEPNSTRPAESPSADATTDGPVATGQTGSKTATRTYKGNGTKVLKIKKPGLVTGPVLLAATYRGGGDFRIVGRDSSLHRTGTVVDVIGRYAGTNMLDSHGTQTRTLKIQAHGPWTVKLRLVATATRVSTHAKGRGDDVLLYTGTNGVATFDYRGKLRFVVKYADGSNGVLVHQVGRFLGQVPIKKGPVLIEVSADGAWTFNVTP
jgi:hypothetical protein